METKLFYYVIYSAIWAPMMLLCLYFGFFTTLECETPGLGILIVLRIYGFEQLLAFFQTVFMYYRYRHIHLDSVRGTPLNNFLLFESILSILIWSMLITSLALQHNYCSQESVFKFALVLSILIPIFFWCPVNIFKDREEMLPIYEPMDNQTQEILPRG